MDSDGVNKGDPIEIAAAEIARDAADIERARAREEEVSAEVAQLDGQIAALQQKRKGLEQERESLHEREVHDDREIARDAAIVAGELGDNPTPPVCPPPVATYVFYVDGVEYTTDQAHMTGRQIKAKVVDWDPTHDLTLEGTGSEPDRIVRDDEEIDFAKAPAPLHFSSTPKANFG